MQFHDDSMNTEFHKEQISFEDSVAGKTINELKKLRQEFDKYCDEQKAKDIAYEKSRKAERKRNAFISLALGSLSGIFSGLIIYYWPSIVSWLHAIIQ